MTVTRIFFVIFWLHTASFHQVTVVTYKDYLYRHCTVVGDWCITNLALTGSGFCQYIHILGVEIKMAKWEGRCVNGLLKEHHRDTCMWLLWNQTSTVSEHTNKTRHYLLWDKVKYIYDWYSWKVKKDVHTRLHPNNINWEKEIEFLEACVDAYDQTALQLIATTTDCWWIRTVSSSKNTNNALDQKPPNHKQLGLWYTNHQQLWWCRKSYSVNQHNCLMKTYRMRPKCCNQYPSDSSETLKYMLTTINNICHDPAFFVLFYRLLHYRNTHVNLLASMLTCISMICCVIHQFCLVLQLIHSLLVSEDYISYSLFVSEDHISKSKSQIKVASGCLCQKSPPSILEVYNVLLCTCTWLFIIFWICNLVNMDIWDSAFFNLLASKDIICR